MSVLRDELSATVHQPEGRETSLLDHARVKAFGGSTAQHWALARELAEKLTEHDTIFAIGEDMGYPIAAYFPDVRLRPRIVVQLQNPDRPRGRLALRYFDIAGAVDCFIATTRPRVEFIQGFLDLPDEQVAVIGEVTDTEFFTPGPVSPDKARPVIGSCGLEHRDYITLAQATADLDVDVKICAVSPNATALKDTFPVPIPDNMHVGYFDWSDLVQLYRDSDAVVISVRPNNFQAGEGVFMEALACERPVIVTETDGMIRDFAAQGFVQPVPMRDADAMRAAIEHVLEHPERAAGAATRGREHVLENLTLEQYVERIAVILRRLAPRRHTSTFPAVSEGALDSARPASTGS